MTKYQRIVAARNAGGSWQAIADAFGISRDAARGIYSRSRTPERLEAHHQSSNVRNRRRYGRSKTESDLARRKFDYALAADLRRQGLTFAAIAVQFGVVTSAVHRAVSREKLNVGH